MAGETAQAGEVFLENLSLFPTHGRGKKPQVWWHACNPSTGEMETGGFLRFTGQQDDMVSSRPMKGRRRS